jgi:hypothetical protein
MIRRALPVQRADAMTGWIKWAMLLAAPVMALAFDTWLNTEILRNDYEVALVSKQLKERSDTLDGLRVEEAKLQTFDRIEIEAPDLGLIEPQPNQVQIIHCSDEEARALEDTFFYTALRGKPNGIATDGRTESVTRMAALPFDLPRNEGAKWENIEPSSSKTGVLRPQTSTTPMGDLLRKAIYSACASSPGDL